MGRCCFKIHSTTTLQICRPDCRNRYSAEGWSRQSIMRIEIHWARLWTYAASGDTSLDICLAGPIVALSNLTRSLPSTGVDSVLGVETRESAARGGVPLDTPDRLLGVGMVARQACTDMTIVHDIGDRDRRDLGLFQEANIRTPKRIHRQLRPG
jgi:hypothetical protein